MAAQDRGLNTPTNPTVVQHSSNRGKTLSAIALLLSSLALLGTGLTLFQVSQLRQEHSQLRDSINKSTVANSSNARPQAPLTAQTNDGTSATYSAVPPNTVPPANTATTQAPVSNAGIQPGQFVQPVFGTKGRIELLRVNRVEGQPDIVNVQMRVRVLRPQVTTYSDSIYLEGTTARNRQTTATYKAVSGESTGSVSLFSMKIQNQTSADAYVWLQIPREVSNVDIYLPNTQAFQNVPIAN